MPGLKHKLPALRHHKPSGRAVVTLNGRDHYCGSWNSPESRAEYDRLIAEWLAAGRGSPKSTPDAPSADPSVSEILVAFLKHAEIHYRSPAGELSSEVENLKDAIRPLRRLYGRTLARSFGPLALRAVRDEMVRSGLARTTVNARINRVRRVFRWAASVELVPAAVVQQLATVDGLRIGRTQARETEGVKPVSIDDVEATLPFMPRPVAAMVRLQLACGCRAGEVVVMRGCDLTPGDPVWEYRPGAHKNAWRGMTRVIPLGPRGQAIVQEFLKPTLESFLFSPQDSIAEIQTRRTTARKSRRTPSESAKRVARPGQRHGQRYTTNTFGQAIRRACIKAGVTVWSPLQLRHTAATLIRARFGLEAAQASHRTRKGRRDPTLRGAGSCQSTGGRGGDWVKFGRNERYGERLTL
jgi:integrase